MTVTTNADRVSEVISTIYAAVGSPEGFTPAVQSIRGLINGSSGMLFTPLCDPADGGFGFVDHFDTEFYRRYREYFCGQDVLAREAYRKGLIRTGAVATNEMLISDSDFRKEPIYHEGHVPMDATRVCCSVIMDHTDASFPHTFLSIFRGARSRPFTEEDCQVMRIVMPHVLQALRLARRLSFAETRANEAHDALHELECGVLILSAGRRVLFMNRAAERLCSRENGLTALSGRTRGECTLEAVLSGDDVALQKAIEGAVGSCRPHLRASPPSTPPTPLAIHGCGRSRCLTVTVLPVPPRFVSAGIIPAHAIILVEAPSDPRPVSERLLSTLFQVTSAESRVAQALVTGDKPKTIADHLGVSEHTVRTHIRALYRKTDTRGISALIALLTRLPQTRAAGLAGTDSASS